jgi:hypothetical protein
MDLKVLQMFDGISNSRIALNLRDFKLFGQETFDYSLGVWGIGSSQESIHGSKFAFVLSVDLSGHASALPLQVSDFPVQSLSPSLEPLLPLAQSLVIPMAYYPSGNYREGCYFNYSPCY